MDGGTGGYLLSVGPDELDAELCHHCTVLAGDVYLPTAAGRVVAAERCPPAEQLAAARWLGLRVPADERLLEDLVEELKRRCCRTQLVADPAIDHHE